MSLKSWISKYVRVAPPLAGEQRLKETIKAMREGDAPRRKEHAFIEERLLVPLHTFRDYDSYVEAGSKNVWATFRACHIAASRVVSTVFTLETDKGSPAKSPLLEALLASPNPYMTWQELLYMGVFHLKLTGNFYLHKDMLSGVTRQPLHLYPLLPQYVQPMPDKEKLVSGYKYRINGHEINYKPEEIIHIKRPHPSKLILGMGDIEPSEPLYNEFINRNSLEEKFMERGASPSAIMTMEDSDDTDPSEWARIKASYTEDYSGKNNAGKIMFLGGKWTYTRLGLSHQEMQSVERSKLTLEQIFLNHGVPLSVAGISSAANYATARLEERNFRLYEIVPLLDLIIGKFNAEGALVRLFGEKLRMGYELSGLVDVEQVWKDYGNLFLNGGITINEMRELMDLPPDPTNPLLDTFYVPSGRIPLDMAGMATTEVPLEDDPANDTESDANTPSGEPTSGERMIAAAMKKMGGRSKR